MNQTLMPRLTVLIPISQMHQRLQLIGNTLEEAKEFPEIELRIVHDIQDTKTSAELKILLNKFKSIPIHFHEGYFGTAGKARNIGLANITSEWFMFWDSDDKPNIREIYEFLARQDLENIDLVVGSYSIHRDGRSLPLSFHKSSYLNLASNPGIWRCIFRTRNLKDTKFSDFKVAEDQLFIINYLTNTKRIRFSQENFYTYYVNQPHQTTSNFKNLANLPQSAAETFKMLPSLSWKWKPVAFIMASRQSLTYIRKYRELSILKRIVNLLSAR